MRLVARLRAAHTAAGFLTVAAAVAGAAARHDRSAGGPVQQFLGAAVEGGIALCALVVVWVVCRRGRSERTRDTRLDAALITYLPGSALALLALSVLFASWSRPDWQSSGSLPGEATFRLLALGQGVLVVVLAVVARGLYRRTPEPRTILYGLGGPAVAMLACALGGVMTGGVAQRVADWLDGSGTPGMGHGTDIAGPPVLLSWQASVIPVLLLLLLVPVLVLVVRTARTAHAAGPGHRGGVRPEAPDEGRTRRIARIRATAALTDSAPWIVGVVSAATLLLGAGAIMRLLAQRRGAGPGRRRERAAPRIVRRGRAVDRLLADRLRLHTVRRRWPPRLQGRLGPPHHRHPLGRGHLLAARRPPLRAPVLRRARRPRPRLPDVRLDDHHAPR